MRALWLIIPSLAVGCASPVAPDLDRQHATQPNLGEPFQLRVGEQAVIEGVDLDVRFVELSNDSRCPSNALILCIWEGDAAIVVETSPKHGDALQHELHTNLEPTSVSVGFVRLTLQRLDPYPLGVEPIPSDQYLATFVVEILK
ncbi:MAG: hypothetical protein P8X82_05725 [Gemmatimonadales bacterium]|jgi:hypothetical protein